MRVQSASPRCMARWRSGLHKRYVRVSAADVDAAASPAGPASEGGEASDGQQGVDDKNLEMMRKFSEQYCKASGTYFCSEKSVTAVVIQGLAEHKKELGAPLCPCRHYDDKAAEVKMGYWNCPCTPMRERKECHCMLFLTEDNAFVGKDQTITTEEIKENL